MTLARIRRPSYADVVASTPARAPQELDKPPKSNVKVVVRIRPHNKAEREGNSRCVVKAMNEHVLVFDPKEVDSPEYGYRNRRRRHRDIRKRQCKDLKFAFDYVYGPNSVNNDIYQNTTKQILDGLLEGYNCSVFAYGATGAGKTHTMLGNPNQPGVIYLTMMDLYNRIEAMQSEKTCDVAISYVEVYNEKIRDLLSKGQCLPMRETPEKGVVIQGLSLHKPQTAEELLNMLHFGNVNRTQHPTDANSESSRSHAVFQVFVRQRDRTANISADVNIAKMCLVDLAGSERATVTKNCGARFREGANINRSLLALGNVINALADVKYKGHIPYRDSKLTRILKDSLGGNCQTVMIAAVSPSGFTYEDTYNTLKYADRAQHIQSTLKKNVLSVDFHVAKYGQIVVELRQEIIELKGKLQLYEEGKITTSSTQQMSPEISSLKEKMESLFSTRLDICREVLDAELKSRDLKWKIFRKERCLARMFTMNEAQNGSKHRIQKTIVASRHLCSHFQNNRDNAMSRLDRNKDNLDMMKKSVDSQGTCQFAENLRLHLQLHETKLALTESQYCVRYLSKVVKSQEREVQGTERLVLQLLQVVRRQRLILKDSGLLTSDLESDFHNLNSMVEGKEVCFADQNADTSVSESFSLHDMIDFKSLPADKSCAGELAECTSNLSVTSSDISVCHQNLVSSQGPQRVHVSRSMPHPMRLPGGSVSYREVPQNSLSDNFIDAQHVSKESVTQSLSFNIEKTWQENPVSVLEIPQGNLAGGENPMVKRNVGHTPSVKKIQDTTTCDTEKVLQCPPLSMSGLSGNFSSVCDTPYRTATDSVQTTVCHTTVQVSNSSHCSDSLKSSEHNKPGSVVSVTSSQNPVPQGTGDIDVPSHDLNSTFTFPVYHNPDPSVVSLTPVIEKFNVPSVKSQISVNNLSSGVDCKGSATNSQEMCMKSVKPAMLNSNINACQTICEPHRQESNSSRNVNNSTDSLQQQVVHSHLVTKSTDNLPQRVHSQTVTKSTDNLPQRLIHSQTVTKSTDNLSQRVIHSQTVTKSTDNMSQKPIQCHTDKKETLDSESKDKRPCVRSILFDCTPSKGRSYAEVAASPPTAGRPPLRQVNSNTPLATVLTPTFSQNASADKENTPDLNAGKKLARRIWDDESKKNAKNLQRLGLFSLAERHQQSSSDLNRDGGPSYMKLTKSAHQRHRHQSRHPKKISDYEEKNKYKTNPSKTLSFQRSRSTSSLSKPGWQL